MGNTVFIYLVSNGEYSSYTADGYIITEKLFTNQELLEMQTECGENSLPEYLKSKGYVIQYFAGEFWESYFKPTSLKEFKSLVKTGKENSFRLHLA